MGIPVRVLLCCGVVCLVLGCSEPYGSGSGSGPAYERICGEVCQRTVDLGDHLASIEDEASLEAALPKVRSTVDDIVKALKRQNEIVSSGFQPSEAIEEKWKAKLAESMEGVAPQHDRLAGIRGFEKIKAEIIRLTKIPPPKVPTQAASKSGRPKVSKQMQDDLTALGRLYHASYDTNKKFVSSWKEAEDFCRRSGRQSDLELLRRLKSQGVTVHWGIHFRGALLCLDGHVEAATPGELMAFLAFQMDNDLKAFGKTPPVPVKFAAGTKQQNPRPGFMILREPWPPDSAPPKPPLVPPPVPPPSRPAEEPAGGGAAPGLGQNAATPSKSEPKPPLDQPATDPADPVPGRPNPFGAGPWRGMSMDDLQRPPTIRFGGPVQPTAPLHAGPHPATPLSTVKTIDSQLVGGSLGWPWRTVDTAGRPVIGVRHSLGRWDDQDTLGIFEPIFDRKNSPPGANELFAKDGYAVGAIQVDGADFVNAVRVAFMRIEGDRLNPKDTYISDWIGKLTGRDPVTINGNGAIVVGVHGRRGAILNAVGLVCKAE